MIVSEVPGTTRDAIDTVLRRDETTFVLVDTAGMRRKRKHRQGIEYWSELRTLEAAERADVALVLVAASEGITEGDLAVADVARKSHASTIVVLSKWDVTEHRLEELKPQLDRRLRQRPPVIAVSAKHRPRHRPPARPDRDAVRQAHGADRHGRAESLPEGAARVAPRAEQGRALAQPPLRRAGADAAAALPLPRQRPRPRHARLRLLGREPAARALRARGRSRLDRLRAPMRAIVVGCGSWGTAFAWLLHDRGPRGRLACRDAEQARAIGETGRNPRYSTTADLRGIARDDRRGGAVRRRGRGRRLRPQPRLPRGRRGDPRRGADPEPDEGPRPDDREPGCRRPSTAAATPSCPARTWPRRSSRACRRPA